MPIPPPARIVALYRRRAGVIAQVLDDGVIRVGDVIEWESAPDAAPRSGGAAFAFRKA